LDNIVPILLELPLPEEFAITIDVRVKCFDGVVGHSSLCSGIGERGGAILLFVMCLQNLMHRLMFSILAYFSSCVAYTNESIQHLLDDIPAAVVIISCLHIIM